MEDAQKGPPKSEIIVLAEVEYIQGIILDHKINIEVWCIFKKGNIYSGRTILFSIGDTLAEVTKFTEQMLWIIIANWKGSRRNMKECKKIRNYGLWRKIKAAVFL